VSVIKLKISGGSNKTGRILVPPFWNKMNQIFIVCARKNDEEIDQPRPAQRQTMAPAWVTSAATSNWP